MSGQRAHWTRDAVLSQIRGKLIVSCQAYPGEPLRDPSTTAQMAQAVVAGGGAGVRVQGVEDVAAAVAAVDVPTIGLWKDGASGVFITPTLDHALAIARAGAHVVAIDGTRRLRRDGRTLEQTVAAFREQASADVLVMADCGSLDDALAAQDAGVDLLGTTLAGYTGERAKTDGPDFELVDQILAACTLPTIVEGRLHTPAQAAGAMARGAYSVCVGTAITHPTTITGWFVDSLPPRVEALE